VASAIAETLADAPQVERHFDPRTERVFWHPAAHEITLTRFGVELLRDEVCPEARTLRPLSLAVLTGTPKARRHAHRVLTEAAARKAGR
jgi:hypothetical protein